MGRKFHLLTYGCQMNEYDSRVIASILTTAGYLETNTLETADIIIVNTCSVRENAENRALGRISELQGLKKANPNLLIAAVVCMAQNLG
ncbi:MAG: tRNA (N6-isopentenyl adenosine(37)-C2)-methylthiotransferase MiaB, partial [Candidatus Stahlbacteria bacterium]|nr:tRNA (N6-isopentenyl adenosine(37)-C2)-methylthiotransferase MiaB [Candidatus Stahlbacteria bacterium]